MEGAAHRPRTGAPPSDGPAPRVLTVMIGSVALHALAFIAFGYVEGPALQAASAPTWITFDALEQPVAVPEPEPEPVVEPEPAPEPPPAPAVTPPPRERDPEPVVEPEPVEEPAPVVEARSSDDETDPTEEAAEPPVSEGIASHEGGMATDLPAAPGGGRGAPIAREPAPDARPSPPRPTRPAVDVRALVRGWVTDVGRLLAQRAGAEYPRAAQRARLEGMVVLSLVVDAEGRVLQVRLRRSSGHDTLDEAAIAMVHRIGEVPAPPSQLHWEPRPLTVPVAYRLR